MRSRVWNLSTVLGVLATTSLLWIHRATAYPVILAIDESTERCFQVNVPEDDDVHVILLPIPDSEVLEDDAVEIWYVQQVFEMTKKKPADGVLPNKLPGESPDKVAKAVSEFLKEKPGTSPIKVRMNVRSYDGKKAMTNYRTKFFVPLVINRVSKVGRKLDDVEGAEICIQNMEEGESYHVIFDSILESEEVEQADQAKKPTFQKEEHLTPLEESLEKSIAAANNVLKEMDYMESREKRMKVTSESINTRVQWFSYLSVGILFVVTYIQVTYLRRYFHKKKLM